MIIGGSPHLNKTTLSRLDKVIDGEQFNTNRIPHPPGRTTTTTTTTTDHQTTVSNPTQLIGRHTKLTLQHNTPHLVQVMVQMVVHDLSLRSDGYILECVNDLLSSTKDGYTENICVYLSFALFS